MQLLDTNTFTVEKAAVGKDKVPRCQLSLGNDTVTLKGVLLKACVQYQSDYLLFLTEDNWTEETLHIYLLDEQLQQKDYAALCWMYATGFFRDLTVASPHSLTFHFFNQGTWEIVLSDQQQRRIPIFSDPTGAWRGFKWHCHFTIRNHQ